MTQARFGEPARLIHPGEFEPPKHFYPRVLNAQIHPTVRHFFALGPDRVLARFCHMKPDVDRERLRELIAYQPRFLRWAGCDLFHVATAGGVRQMVVIETNSCPSGQKSMPLFDDTDEHGGYRRLLSECFLPSLTGRRLPSGALAVIYDKNDMGNSGYAATLADASGEPVYAVTFFDGDPDPSVRFVDGVAQVRDAQGSWQPIRAAFRYVTQRPWNRLPLHSRTEIFNPVRACLAGGRNKLVAAKAYELFNAELSGSGLAIRVPETFWDVSHREIPLWVKRLGGLAAVKIPYSNAGQGVFTIANKAELDAFMDQAQPYDQYVVQSLIGNFNWSALAPQRRLFHVATVPDKRCNSYVADLRMMVIATPTGIRPGAIYARRARLPLVDRPPEGIGSWDMLGTNLSFKREDGGWGSDTDRLLLMDRRDFNALGLGLDELIDAYVQCTLAVVAIDKMASELTTRKGRFRMKLFSSLDPDPTLLEEIRSCPNDLPTTY